MPAAAGTGERLGERRETQFTCEVAAADGGGWCVEEKGT
jgi:hypothetical protein